MTGSVMQYMSNFLRTLLLVLGFLPLSYSFADNKIIKRIHFSEVGAQTRVTFGLSESFPLELEEDSAHDKVTIKAPEGAVWHLNDEKTLGFVKKYHVKDSVLSLEIVPGTDIDDYGLQKNKAGESEFFVDLKNQEKQQAHQEKTEEKKAPASIEKPTIEKEEIPQVLKKVGIQKEGSETVLTLETTTPISFDPDLQQAKKKLIIALPKTNWLYVDTKEKQGGVIQGYHVDESSPHASKMVFSLKSSVDMTVHSPVEGDGHHQYRITFKASVDANASVIEEEGSSKKKRGKVQTVLPTKLPSKPQKVRKKHTPSLVTPTPSLVTPAPSLVTPAQAGAQSKKRDLESTKGRESGDASEVALGARRLRGDDKFGGMFPIQEATDSGKKPQVKEMPKSEFKLEYKPEPKIEVKEEPKEEASASEKEPPAEQHIEQPVEHKIEEKASEPAAVEPTPESPQEPAAFAIEGEEGALHEEELREDLKGLQISLSLPEEMAYVHKEDLKKDNLKEEPPKLLKKFKIAPSQDVASIASQQPTPQHLPLSNAGTMFTRLQATPEAQASNEGTAPAWVIEAKMKERQD